jgi:hypothetical protein
VTSRSGGNRPRLRQTSGAESTRGHVKRVDKDGIVGDIGMKGVRHGTGPGLEDSRGVLEGE